MWFFDLERLDVVKRLENWFSWGAIVFVGLMVVCEVISHRLSERRDELVAQPRKLSSRQSNVLVRELQRLPKGKVGLCAPHARESEIFARQVLANFLRSGWSASLVVADLPESELDSGILLISYDGNTPPSTPDFSAIEQAFLAANISYKKVRLASQAPYRGNVSTDDPVILIGKRYEY